MINNKCLKSLNKLYLSTDACGTALCGMCNKLALLIMIFHTPTRLMQTPTDESEQLLRDEQSRSERQRIERSDTAVQITIHKLARHFACGLARDIKRG